jgi:hypothetical protein
MTHTGTKFRQHFRLILDQKFKFRKVFDVVKSNDLDQKFHVILLIIFHFRCAYFTPNRTWSLNYSVIVFFRTNVRSELCRSKRDAISSQLSIVFLASHLSASMLLEEAFYTSRDKFDQILNPTVIIRYDDHFFRSLSGVCLLFLHLLKMYTVSDFILNIFTYLYHG